MSPESSCAPVARATPEHDAWEDLPPLRAPGTEAETTPRPLPRGPWPASKLPAEGQETPGFRVDTGRNAIAAGLPSRRTAPERPWGYRRTRSGDTPRGVTRGGPVGTSADSSAEEPADLSALPANRSQPLPMERIVRTVERRRAARSREISRGSVAPRRHPAAPLPRSRPAIALRAPGESPPGARPSGPPRGPPRPRRAAPRASGARRERAGAAASTPRGRRPRSGGAGPRPPPRRRTFRPPKRPRCRCDRSRPIAPATPARARSRSRAMRLHPGLGPPRGSWPLRLPSFQDEHRRTRRTQDRRSSGAGTQGRPGSWRRVSGTGKDRPGPLPSLKRGCLESGTPARPP